MSVASVMLLGLRESFVVRPHNGALQATGPRFGSVASWVLADVWDKAEGVRERNLTKLWKMDELSGCPDSFASSIPALVIM